MIGLDPWADGLECWRYVCPAVHVGLEHSHITNPPWVPEFARYLIMTGLVG